MMRKNIKKPFFCFVKSIVKIFKKRPKFINPENISQEAAIYISNHAAASGPTTYELYMPINIRLMGAYQMCSTLKDRWNYLYRIYFHQKKKVPKWLSSIVATIVTPFMIMFYKGMQIIPIYPDSRFRITIKKAVDALENGISVLIFPEDSSNGYYEQLTKFFGGFYILAKEYYKKTGKDIKIINMYYHRKKNIIYVDDTKSYLKLSNQFEHHNQVADYFLEKTNALFNKINDIPK